MNTSPTTASSAWDQAESAGEDMEQLAHLLALSPTERLKQHERARLAVAALRQAGRKFYGFDPSDPPPAPRT